MPWKRMLAYVTGEIEPMLLARLEYLIEENRVLRNQLERRPRLNDAERESLARKAIALGKLLADTVTIVKPETILKWHRRLVARKFDGSAHRHTRGRPLVTEDVVEFVVTAARENPTWGYDRIVGAAANIGFTISDTTVGNILRRHGLGPAPERRTNTTWAAFIRRHRECLWATDFFTVEAWTGHGLTTFYVLFFIHVATRRVVLGGITEHPSGPWMAQVARNVTGYDGGLSEARYLIHDRDTKYTAEFDAVFQSVGIEPVKLPPKSPNLNAFAERFVRSIKQECLNRIIVFGERMLRHVIREYLAHYHTERNHQGLDNTIPFPGEAVGRTLGKIQKTERLGGLLCHYHRDASGDDAKAA